MAFNQVTATSLTPSRPAPAAPVKRDVQNVLASSGYASSFSVGAPSPSSSSYNSGYSGIGGSPNRMSDGLSSVHVVRSGTVSVKEDGLVSWLWRPKYLILKEQTLSIHKSEVGVVTVSACFNLLSFRHKHVHDFCPIVCAHVRLLKQKAGGTSVSQFSVHHERSSGSCPLAFLSSCIWSIRALWFLITDSNRLCSTDCTTSTKCREPRRHLDNRTHRSQAILLDSRNQR